MNRLNMNVIGPILYSGIPQCFLLISIARQRVALLIGDGNDTSQSGVNTTCTTIIVPLLSPSCELDVVQHTSFHLL